MDNPLFSNRLFGGFEFKEAPIMTDTKTETRVYKGHPIIQWLAKYFDFDPNTYQTITYQTPKRGMYRMGNIIYGHPAVVRDAMTALKMNCTA